MDDTPATLSFGEWVQRKRQLLDLTQATLAHRVGCAPITIRKIESDERRPSRQMAARLALSLAVAEEDQERFVAVGLGELPAQRLQPLGAAAAPFPPHLLQEKAGVSSDVIRDEIRVVSLVAAGISHATATRLAQRPDESAELIGRIAALVRSIFDEYQIYCEESLEGCLVGAFGAPHRHEDDPERALQAALRLQSVAQRQRLSIAIGVHSGPAYLHRGNGAQGSPIVGATVSLALHLQRQAGDGEILVSRTVYRQTRSAFDFKSDDANGNGEGGVLLLRPRQRMEKSRGIEGYQPPLIGREHELATLAGVVATLGIGAAADNEGQLVILSGDAGVGKSTLIARLRANLMDDGANDANGRHLLWLEGRSLEMTMSSGYGPFLELLRLYFGWQPEDDEARRAKELIVTLQELAGGGHLAQGQIEKIGPHLGNLFSLHFGNEWDEKLLLMAPEVMRRQTFQAIYELLVAVARRQPLVLVFEDLHWADGASLDLIGELMGALPTVRMGLLCVCRPQQAHRSNQLATVAQRKCPGLVTEITLRELPPRQSRQLLHALLGAELPEKVADLILRRAQGNPFFVEEMVHTLITMDLLYQAEDRWWVRPNFDEAVVPDSIHNLLLSRVDRLAPEQKSILHQAAVIGRHFSLPLLALSLSTTAIPAMVLPQGDLEDLLWPLEEQAFIYQERNVPEAIYTFRHILTHEAIYATIPRQRAKRLHGEVARLLETLHAEEVVEYYEPLAYHYNRSDDLPKAVDYLLKAAQKAQRAYLNEEAVAYYNQALARLDELPVTPLTNEQRLTALTDLGRVYYHGVSQLDLAESSLRQALALGKSMDLPPRRLTRIHVWLGDLLMNWQPRMDESLRLGLDALELLGDDNECNEAALSNALVFFSHCQVADIDQGKEYAFRNVEFAHRLTCRDDFDHLIYLSIAIAMLFSLRPAEARHWFEISREEAERGHHLHALAESTLCLCDMLAVEGNVQGALANLPKAAELMVQAGDLKRLNWGQIAELWYRLQLGDLHGFKEVAPLAWTQAQLLNQELVQDLRMCQGIAALVEGEWQEGEYQFRQAIAESETNSANWVEAQLGLGRAYLAQGKIPEATLVFKTIAPAAFELIDFQGRTTKGTRCNFAPLGDTLAALDTALADERALRAFCTILRAEGHGWAKSRFTQWYLERAEIDLAFQYTHVTSLVESWQWLDAFGGSTLSYDNGILIVAANSRDFACFNASAPRLVRSIEGDFVLQTRCEAASGDRPTLGGISLWQSLSNFVRLDWGTRGKQEIALIGSIDRGANEGNFATDLIAGRGRLDCPQPYLRLERKGGWLRALCSADGEAWYLVGEVEFLPHGPLEVGLYAIGNIDRLIYPGRYPDGAAIHFSDIHFWS